MLGWPQEEGRIFGLSRPVEGFIQPVLTKESLKT
jgi:hypothetical protein